MTKWLRRPYCPGAGAGVRWTWWAATLEGMPDEELLGQLTDYFQQRREIAVDVLVRAPEAVTVDVAVKIDGGADRRGPQSG